MIGAADGLFFQHLGIASVLYNFAFANVILCVCVLLLAVCILTMQKPGVFSLCCIPLMLHYESIKTSFVEKRFYLFMQ